MVSTAVRTFARGIPWNLFLLTLGCGLFALGVKAIAIPHMLISGGVFGTALLINYMTETLSPAVWNVLLNIPIFIAGWLFVGRRFVLYSLYGLAVVSVATQYLDMTINITDPILASIAAGCICGLGLGIVLHRLRWRVDHHFHRPAQAVWHQRRAIQPAVQHHAVCTGLFHV